MSKKTLINRKTAPYVFLAPTILIFLIFMIYPILRSFYLSFFELISGSYQFVGFDNYLSLFRDETFFKSLFNTFIYLIIQVPIMIIGALIIAFLIEEKFIKGRGFFRTAIFLPTVTALVAYSLVFKVLLNGDHGLINYVLESMGFQGINWFYEEWPARYAIIISITWRWLGYNMIILLAGIQAIPKDVMEAAEIDGANFWQKFLYITVPMVKQLILFCTITSTIGTLQLHKIILQCFCILSSHKIIVLAIQFFILCLRFYCKKKGKQRKKQTNQENNRKRMAPYFFYNTHLFSTLSLQ